MLWAGFVWNFAGLGYFALTIPCFVVNPFYCAIADSLWWQISLVMLVLPILDPFWCSAVTLVACSSYLNSFNCILIAITKQYKKISLKNFTHIFGWNSIAKSNACVRNRTFIMSGDIASLYRFRWNHRYQKKTYFFCGAHMDGNTEGCTDRGVGSHVTCQYITCHLSVHYNGV